MSAFTIENLAAVEDAAPELGIAEWQETRFARDVLGAVDTGLTLHRFRPGRRQGFGHRHAAAEEVYVVLSGSGRIRLDDEVRELARLDAIRVEPGVLRAFEAGPDGLEVLAFGPHHEGDGEIHPGFWAPEDEGRI